MAPVGALLVLLAAGGLDQRLDCDCAGRHLSDDADSSYVQPNCKQWQGIMIPWPGTSFLTRPAPRHLKLDFLVCLRQLAHPPPPQICSLLLICRGSIMVFRSLGGGLQTKGSYCVSSSTTAEFTMAKRHIHWLCQENKFYHLHTAICGHVC